MKREQRTEKTWISKSIQQAKPLLFPLLLLSSNFPLSDFHLALFCVEKYQRKYNANHSENEIANRWILDTGCMNFRTTIDKRVHTQQNCIKSNTNLYVQNYLDGWGGVHGALMWFLFSNFRYCCSINRNCVPLGSVKVSTKLQSTFL